MAEVGTRKALIASALAAVAICAAILVPHAGALPYAHSEEEADAGMGVVHIAVTLDCSAIGGPTKFVWLPINADSPTVTAVMNEFLNASEDKVDRFAHEDYQMESLADFLSGKQYTVAVYKASAQQPGADATYTSASIGDETYSTLETGDGVYVTVTR